MSSASQVSVEQAEPPGASAGPPLDLAHWMRRAVRERSKAAANLDLEPVHDLRVALRHCVSIAEAQAEFDPYPGWERLQRMARKLLKPLGALRDSQVMIEWLERLGLPEATPRRTLADSLRIEQVALKAAASAALDDFDSRKWKSLEKTLSARAERVPADSLVIHYLVLERWQEARDRHQFALRSRSNVAFHRLRLALKTFRYAVELFLPELYALWGPDLKLLQDVLGERHDLDLVWSKLLGLRSAFSASARLEWKTKIEAEKASRLAQYLAKTKGPSSLFLLWRNSLLNDSQLEEAAIAKLRLWSSFRTPHFRAIERVAEFSLQLFDALAARGFAAGLPTPRPRQILLAAALLEDVGRSERNKGHHKFAYRLIRKQPLPIGWRHADLQLTALVARYHRKALPQPKHEEFSTLSPDAQHATRFLAGILRLGNALARSPGHAIRKIELEVTSDGIVVRAYGFDAEEPLLSRLSSAKRLLEIACRRAVLIIPGVAGAPLRVAAAAASGSSSVSPTKISVATPPKFSTASD